VPAFVINHLRINPSELVVSSQCEWDRPLELFAYNREGHHWSIKSRHGLFYVDHRRQQIAHLVHHANLHIITGSRLRHYAAANSHRHRRISPPNHPQRNRASMERNSNRGGNPIPTQSEAAREAEATHRVLHGGPPPLHGGEAKPEASVLSIGGELVRLGRAEVYPHLLLPPGRLGQQPCTAAKSHGPVVSVRTNPTPISTATPRD